MGTENPIFVIFEKQNAKNFFESFALGQQNFLFGQRSLMNRQVFKPVCQ